MPRDFLLTLAGGLAAGVAGIVVALFSEALRWFRSRSRLRLRTRVFWRGNDFTGVRLVEKYVPDTDDRLEIQITNPTQRRVMVTAAGFSFLRSPPSPRAVLRGRVSFTRHGWPRLLWRLLTQRKWRERVDFDVTHTEMPVPVHPEGLTRIAQSISRLQTRCDEHGRKLSDVQEVWLETIDEKRFEEPVGEDVYWTLKSME